MFTAETYLQNRDLVGFPQLGINFDVSRVAFTIFGIQIYWYGICIVAGMILAVLYCFKRMKEFGLDQDKVMDAVIGGVIGAIIGARLYYIIFDDVKTLADFFDFRDGGLAVYGGILGGMLVGGIVAKIRKVKVLPLFDVASMGFFIGQGIGRWGNFFNKEAFGDATTLPWGMSSASIQNLLGDGPDTLVMAHPCFLYEFLWCLAGFLIMHFYYKHRKFDGELLLIYCVWYGIGRFMIEGLRTDSLYLGNIRVSQLLSGVAAAVAVFLIIFFRSKAKRNPEAFILYKNTDESKQILKEAEEKIALEKEKKLKKAVEIQLQNSNTDTDKTALETKDDNSDVNDMSQKEDKSVTEEEAKSDGKDN